MAKTATATKSAPKGNATGSASLPAVRRGPSPAMQKALDQAQKAAAHARTKVQQEKATLQTVGVITLASAGASYMSVKRPKIMGLDSRLVAGLGALVANAYLKGKTKGLVLAGAVGALASYASDIGKGISGDPGSGVGAMPDPEMYGEDYGRGPRFRRRRADLIEGEDFGDDFGAKRRRGRRRPKSKAEMAKHVASLEAKVRAERRRAAAAEKTAEEAITALEQADTDEADVVVEGEYEGEFEGDDE
ncbi:hypothetical protein L6R50_14795 [Myxococcota bacterium]|nr:hypothetical protein [Myxococcota bacterium]